MTYVHLSNNDSTGTTLGQAAADKIAFYGATPMVQNAALATATDGMNTVAVGVVLNSVITFLKTIGLVAT